MSYEVQVSADLYEPADPTLATAGGSSTQGPPRRLVVIDSTVHRLYGERAAAYFDAHGVQHEFCVIEIHESRKTMDTVLEVVASMDRFGVARRREPVIAMGGGVLTDVVGVATGLYRRSTPYVKVPTTLIGMIDAGIGAKTGVNFGQHKNRLGSYHPATVALIDPSFLLTLDVRQLRNGMAEILKIALIKDRKLFDLLAAHASRLVAERLQRTGSADRGAVAEEVMRRAIHGMLQELAPNLWEQRLRRLVDYGHSFSPTLEMAALPELLHGEAVCVDMALSTVLAHRRGLVGDADVERIWAVIRDLKLPMWHPMLTPELLVGALADTVRHRDGQQLLPLPAGLGDACFVNDVTSAELAAAAEHLRRMCAGGPETVTAGAGPDLVVAGPNGLGGLGGLGGG